MDDEEDRNVFDGCCGIGYTEEDIKALLQQKAYEMWKEDPGTWDSVEECTHWFSYQKTDVFGAKAEAKL